MQQVEHRQSVVVHGHSTRPHELQQGPHTGKLGCHVMIGQVDLEIAIDLAYELPIAPCHVAVDDNSLGRLEERTEIGTDVVGATIRIGIHEVVHPMGPGEDEQ